MSLVAQWLRLHLPMQGVGTDSIPGWSEDPTLHVSHGQKNKTENRSNIVRNSIKTLKLVPH